MHLNGLAIVAVSTGLIYLFVIVALRICGRHPMAQLAPTDLVILMLLGSSVETSMVHGSSGLRAGLVSAAVLIGINRLLNFAMLRSKRFKRLVSGGPTILINHGHFIEEHLKRAGLTQADVMEALREREYGDVAEIRLAILEPDGEVNVIPTDMPPTDAMVENKLMNHWISRVFDHPDPTGCLLIAGKCLLIYVFLIVGLRILGKRELGQMNIYDLVLIIVLGNSVQNAMMNGDNSLVGGLIAATVLLCMNKLFGLLMHRSTHFERAMVGEPVLLLSHGHPIESHMRREGISREQLMQALREHGLTREDEAKIAVLEVDGSISIVANDGASTRTKRHFKALRLP